MMLVEMYHHLPMYEGEMEPGHIPGFACPCGPDVEWNGMVADVVHYPLFPGTDEGFYYAFTDAELCAQ